MQRLDSMLQKMIPNVEQAQPIGAREGTLSPIAEETQEQVASSGDTIEIKKQLRKSKHHKLLVPSILPCQTG